MKITRIETGRRTVLMMAHFLHRDPREIDMAQNLRNDWRMTDRDFEVLELWIEGPISPSVPGFFQDAATDVRVADLQNRRVVATIESLARLIWKSTPASNRAP